MDTTINKKDEKLILKWMHALARIHGVDALEGVNGEYEELRELGNPALLNTDTLGRVAQALRTAPEYDRWYEANEAVCLGLIFGGEVAAKAEFTTKLTMKNPNVKYQNVIKYNVYFQYCECARALTISERKVLRALLTEDVEYSRIWREVHYITEWLGHAPTSYEEAHEVSCALFGTH